MDLTNEQSWVLGLLQTDGYFHHDRPILQIRLSPTDIDVLEKMKVIVDDTKNPIRIVPNNSGKTQIAEFKFTNRFFHGFSYLKVDSPPDFGPTQKRAFLRGLFEGDGSLYWDKRLKHSVVEFTNNNKNIVEYVNIEISTLLGLPLKSVKVDNKERFQGKYSKDLPPTYRAYWSGRRANLIAWFLWHGDIEHFSMDRKRNLYKDQVLNGDDSGSEIERMLRSVKCEMNDDRISINIRADLTLEWAQRIKYLTQSNMTPVILNRGYKKYYGLHVPKELKVDNASPLYKTIWE